MFWPKAVLVGFLVVMSVWLTGSVMFNTISRAEPYARLIGILADLRTKRELAWQACNWIDEVQSKAGQRAIGRLEELSFREEYLSHVNSARLHINDYNQLVRQYNQAMADLEASHPLLLVGITRLGHGWPNRYRMMTYPFWPDWDEPDQLDRTHLAFFRTPPHHLRGGVIFCDIVST